MNILDEIAARTRERIAEEKKRVPIEQIRREAECAHQNGTAFADGGPEQEAFAFERALRQGNYASNVSNGAAGRKDEDRSEAVGMKGALRADEARMHVGGRSDDAGMSAGDHVDDDAGNRRPESQRKACDIAFICEVKKASPSKGLIAPDFPYLQIAMEYEQAGAAAISCLTEPYYFQGHDAYLREIAQQVRIPVLRKDFTVDEYMIYQARAFGAGAVLLICSILDDAQLTAYGQLARELGLSALVEAHTEDEVGRAMRADAKILGVNNRDLKTFQVDLGTSARYRRMVPPETIFVSESGVRNADDIRKLEENGTNAVLIGETLMRAADKKAKLDELRGVM